jgi:hypothetical protein
MFSLLIASFSISDWFNIGTNPMAFSIGAGLNIELFVEFIDLSAAPLLFAARFLASLYFLSWSFFWMLSFYITVSVCNLIATT